MPCVQKLDNGIEIKFLYVIANLSSWQTYSIGGCSSQRVFCTVIGRPQIYAGYNYLESSVSDIDTYICFPKSRLINGPHLIWGFLSSQQNELKNKPTDAA